MFSPKKLLLICLLLLLAAFCGGRWWRQYSLNRWPLTNHPPKADAVLCFGDSLVAGIGASTAESSYPGQLGKLLGLPVYAAGFPGATAEDGWRKLEAAPQLRAGIVIVTLGGNDIMKSVPLAATVGHLRQIFRELQRRGALVAFTEVRGLVGSARGKAYLALCRENGVVFIPDIMAGILGNPELKSDQIHPNDQGYMLIASRVHQMLQKVALPRQ